MANVTPPGELSEEQRRAAFRAELDRAGVPGGRATRSRLPPRVVLWVAAAFLSLGVGGSILEHFVGGASKAPSTTTTAVPASTTTVRPSASAALNAFIGLKEISSAIAPPIVLTDETGRTWRLGDQRAHLTLVTFFSRNCDDICPVEGAELGDALALLAARHVTVEVAVVNTDPHLLARVANPAALRVPGLAGRANVHFLTGSLRALNAVWSAYGVTVRVGATPGEVSHNDVIYFVDGRGRLRALAIPFSRSGVTPRTLSAADEHRFAQGLVAEAGSLSR